MKNPTAAELYDVIEGTWPPANRTTVGPFIIREGQGGGSRVSAATGPADETDLPLAEEAMRALGQPCQFMIRDGEADFDAVLAGKGYRIKDPVTLYAAPIDRIATHRPPPVTTFEVWPALAIQADIWAEGGIGSERMAVMERADCPKTTILGRINDTPAGTAYVGISNGIAMFHALEVAQRFRRQGLAAHMIRAMAFWARENGAKHFALVVTEANVGANALYASLGFDVVGHYHYRILPE